MLHLCFLPTFCRVERFDPLWFAKGFTKQAMKNSAALSDAVSTLVTCVQRDLYSYAASSETGAAAEELARKR
jgi:hypothetical protein